MYSVKYFVVTVMKIGIEVVRIRDLRLSLSQSYDM